MSRLSRHASREGALRSIAFEPTVQDLTVAEDLLDALLDANTKYLDPAFVAKIEKKDARRRVAVEASPDNPFRPDALHPPPAMDLLAGTQ